MGMPAAVRKNEFSRAILSRETVVSRELRNTRLASEAHVFCVPPACSRESHMLPGGLPPLPPSFSLAPSLLVPSGFNSPSTAIDLTPALGQPKL